jgi:hypothetical protein
MKVILLDPIRITDSNIVVLYNTNLIDQNFFKICEFLQKFRFPILSGSIYLKKVNIFLSFGRKKYTNP